MKIILDEALLLLLFRGSYMRIKFGLATMAYTLPAIHICHRFWYILDTTGFFLAIWLWQTLRIKFQKGLIFTLCVFNLKYLWQNMVKNQKKGQL